MEAGHVAAAALDAARDDLAMHMSPKVVLTGFLLSLGSLARRAASPAGGR